ncbi:MAG: PHP domain-containing protein [Phycisphaerales bacterium]|nr:PHP domain-containing protein [Phycisphaerales bacterium]
MYVDLHCHSTASDGTFRPAQVIQLAHRCGVSALSLTDHDTVGGIAEAADAAAGLGIEFLPGIEISSEFPKPGTLHMLGYGIDPSSPALQALTARLVEARRERNPRIIHRLNELGIAVSMEDWLAEAAGGVPGRPHLAAVLVRKGYVSSVRQAFDRYLGEGRPAYVEKDRLSSREAIDLIRQAGGVAVLAHPVQLRRENFAQVETIVKQLMDEGLGGLEVLHSDHDELTVRELQRIAERFGLLKTGGSDFHGSNKPEIRLGVANGRVVPREWFEALRDAIKRP